MKWEPIETAPKDGMPILAYRKPSEFAVSSCLIFVAWNDESKSWVWPDSTYDPYLHDSYTEAYENGDEFESNEFTHWMPLPAPPNQPE